MPIVKSLTCKTAALALLSLASWSPAPALAQLQAPRLVAYGLTAPGFLIRFDTRAPRRSTKTIGWLFPEAGGSMVGIDFRPQDGGLYGVDNRGVVYRINLGDGLLSVVGRINGGLIGARFGVDFNPVDGLLQVVSDSGQRRAFNVQTGVTTVLPDLNDGITPPMTRRGTSGLAFDGNDTVATTGSTLYGLDHETDRLIRIDPATGAVTAVAAIRSSRRFAKPVTLIGGDGFDIHAVRDASGATTANLAYVSLKPESRNDAVLHRIDLATGVVTPIGSVNPNPSGDLLDFSIQPDP